MSVFRKIRKFFIYLWSIRWAKPIILVVGIPTLLFLVLLIGQKAAPKTIQAALCASCHEMKPEYATFKVSAHKGFSCIDCHKDYSVGQILLHNKKKVLNEVVKHFKESYVLPLVSIQPLPNSVCESCHSSNRPLTPSGDSNLSREKHNEHVTKGITCVTCHVGVAHGTIMERQATIGDDLDSWDDNKGRQNMSWQVRMINMTKCMECHKAENAPLDCKSCHLKIIRPPTHANPTWVKDGIHGQEAYKDIKLCDSCHSNSRTTYTLNLRDPVAEYARTNSYCIDCHQTKPQGHHQGWSAQHGQIAQKNTNYCLVCHLQAGTPKKEGMVQNVDKTPATVCNSCHKAKHQISINHPTPIPKGTKPGGECYSCHRADLCSKCHK